ncbi:hypothetical protein Fcan01_11212 [Folsomia candida]|uniref:Uncharacterized protein n=1 Tax=Folsomia candida TaxID=158441 RepID=A0A226EBZ2_FOLCA|nr:hypothetical protein Fcan01_11212 [Folsomia candida]
MHLLLGILLFFALQPFQRIRCSRGKHFSITGLLARSEYCQVKIVYDKIGDDMLQPVSSFTLHPITLISLGYTVRTSNETPSRYNGFDGETVRGLCKVGNSKCRISFIVYEYYFPGNLSLPGPYHGYWMRASDHQYKPCKGAVSYYRFAHKNVMKILISAIVKSDLNELFEYPYLEPGSGHPIFDNFGILFLARNQTFHLCVQPIGQTSKSISTMQCKHSGNGSIVQLFRKLISVPILWRVESNKAMHIEESPHGQLDFSKLPFYSNPFNRLENYSVYQHLLQSVFRQANASLYCNYGEWRRFNYGARLQLTRINGLYDGLERGQSVIFRYNGCQFITCYSQTYISFEFYFSPFPPVVWGILLVSVVIVSVVLTLFKKYTNINSYEAFCPWSFVLANIFEEAGYVPGGLGKQNFF